MVDLTLLVGRILLLALLYLFLFAAVRAGMGLIRRGAPSRGAQPLMLAITAGPPELRGTRIALDREVRIGRAPGLELTIADDFVSTDHARITPTHTGPVIEDLDSTNGTLLNGKKVSAPARLNAGDVVEIGTLSMKVVR